MRTCVDRLRDASTPPPSDAPPRDAAADASIDAPIDAAQTPAGLVMHLRMDDPPGDGVLDSAGMHAAACMSCPSLVAGHDGMAYEFSNDLVAVADAIDLRPGTGFTVAAWIRTNMIASEGVIVAKTFQNSNATYWVSATTPMRSFFYTPNNSASGPNNLTNGAWHHLAMTWDGSDVRGYVNASQVASYGAPMLPSDNGPLQIGGFRDGERFNGAIDDVMFFNRALTAAEVAQLAQ